MRILPITLLAATATLAGGASADTMYKCTDPNGKVTFSDQPCTGKSKAATLHVTAPQRARENEGDEDDDEGPLLRRKPKETELERLRRADADFQQRFRKREAAEAEEAAVITKETRRANQSAERLKPTIDPKQTVVLTLPTERERRLAAQQRQEEEKRRRDAQLPSIH